MRERSLAVLVLVLLPFTSRALLLTMPFRGCLLAVGFWQRVRTRFCERPRYRSYPVRNGLRPEALRPHLLAGLPLFGCAIATPVPTGAGGALCKSTVSGKHAKSRDESHGSAWIMEKMRKSGYLRRQDAPDRRITREPGLRNRCNCHRSRTALRSPEIASMPAARPQAPSQTAP